MVAQYDIQQKETEQSMCDVNSVQQDEWMVPLEINGAVIPLRLDTGSKANLISEIDIKAMKMKPRLHPNSVKLIKSANQHKRLLQTKGET